MKKSYVLFVVMNDVKMSQAARGMSRKGANVTRAQGSGQRLTLECIVLI